MICTDTQPTTTTLQQVWPQLASQIQTLLDQAPVSPVRFQARMDWMLLKHRIQNLPLDQVLALLPCLIQLGNRLESLSLEDLADALEKLNSPSLVPPFYINTPA